MDVSLWLKETKIRSYDALVVWCKANNVEPPTKDEMKGKFGAKRAPTQPAAAVVPPTPVLRAEPTPVEKASKKPPKKAKKASKTEPTGQ